MDIKVIQDKFKSLSGREKLIIIINLVAIVVVVPYMLLYSPSVLQIKNKKQALQAVKSEIEAINITLASQAAIPKEPVVEKIVLRRRKTFQGC